MNYTMKPDLQIERKVWLVRNPGIIAQLCQQLGVSPSMIYGVLMGRRRSARVSAALAEAGAPGFKEKRQECTKAESHAKARDENLPAANALKGWALRRSRRD